MRNRLSPTRLRKRSPLLGIEGLEDRVVPAAILNITNAPTGIFPQFDLVDPNPDVGGVFGTQVLYLPSGNIIVTDPGDDAGGVDAGAVYLFNGTTGALISALTGSHANDHLSLNGVQVLTNGNFVVVSIEWDNGSAVDAGAVTWGSSITGVSGVVSAANSLVGSQAKDNVGGDSSGGDSGLTLLANGNYVVRSRSWDNGAVVDAGAVTWGNGTTGTSGTVSAANSLVGSSKLDLLTAMVKVLANGNYVVVSPQWDNGTAVNAGAATWANGTVGIRGAITPINSLVGSTSEDQVGYNTIQALTNGNYLVISQTWYNGVVANAGAVTWGNGTTGVSGVVTAANSLIGSQEDKLGNGDVLELRNGNYLVRSPFWDNGTNRDAGAITWGNGKTGVTGVVSAANSLVGSHTGDLVGIDGVTMLAKGNYIVNSSYWDNGTVADAGAATWGDDTTGVSGVVSAANSLVGSQTNEISGGSFSKSSITLLTNGNYIVRNPSWSSDTNRFAGAATWGSGTTGIRGTISSANSLIGTSAFDYVGFGGVTELTNGNYLVQSNFWDNGNVSGAGAITWGNGKTGVSGVVSPANSLVGSQTGDRVGLGVTQLTNGNYVVVSSQWNNGTAARAGAFTWGNGTTGVTGVVSAANSLVGSSFNDGLVPDAYPYDFRAKSFASAVPLTNGNYIVTWPDWNNGTIVDAGAATWGDGTNGTSGIVSAANSLVGTTEADFVGRRVVPLANGNYVVESPQWNNGTVRDAGAVTWGNGVTGISGAVSIANSLVGSSGFDMVGSVEPLPDGNYNVRSPFWDNGGVFDPGVLTFGDGTKGIAGIITPANSLIGPQSNQFAPNTNGNLINGNVLATRIPNSPGADRVVFTWYSGTNGQTLDGLFNFTPQNSIFGNFRFRFPSIAFSVTPDKRMFVADFSDGPGRVVVGFPDANLLTFERGGAQPLNVTPNLFALSLNSGQDVLSQATTTIAVTSPIVTDNPTGNGGALTLESLGALNLNANITTDNGNLTLLGTTITPAAGVTVNTGTGTLNLPSGKLVLNQTLAVNGGVNLSGVSLTATLLPTIQGKSVTLIDKLSSGPIAGTFAGLAQGAQLTIGGADFTISYIGGDGNDTTLTRLSASVSVPVLVGFPQFAAGTDVGGGTATLFDPGLSVRFSVTPFVGFTGGVRTATADFNGDGVADLVVGTGPGIATQVRIFDGKTQAELFFVSPFENTFTGGVYISAGDVTGDGIPDLAITPDEGGGPRVDVYSGAAGFPKLTAFFGIDDVNFRGGARSAIADMTGDGVADLIVVAGFGGGPRVAGFDGKSLSGTPLKIFGDFFAFEQALRNGIFVTAGDINGDGFADLIAGGGPGGGPRVLAFDGKSLLTNQYVNLANFFGGDVDSRGGIRVAVKNLDGDTKADLVVGSGAGAGSRLTGYLGANIGPSGTPTTQFDFDALAGFSGGVFVG